MIKEEICMDEDFSLSQLGIDTGVFKYNEITFGLEVSGLLFCLNKCKHLTV